MIKNQPIKIKSVSEYLDALKQIDKKQKHQYFFRGVSKEEYATPENDVPGIFREKKKDHKELWVESEHKMFYRFISQCPESFDNCRSIFEYLVMMQHYEYPTRLLDITSNPLVALYFACNGFSTLRGEKLKPESGTGVVLIYEVEEENIRHHESDRVRVLSNITIANPDLSFINFIFNELQFIMNQITINIKRSKDLILNNKFSSNLSEEIKNYIEHKAIADSAMEYLLKKEYLFNDIDKIIDKKFPGTEKSINKDQMLLAFLDNVFSSFQLLKVLNQKSCNNLKDPLNNKDIDINKSLETVKLILEETDVLIKMINRYCSQSNQSSFDKYCYNIKNEKVAFNSNFIDSQDVKTVQCVRSKQDNPRIIAQQGMFLLFGLKDELSTKINKPIMPDSMYAQSKEKNKITIMIDPEIDDDTKIDKTKQRILDELNQLGVSNKTLFPEISNIAYEVKKEFNMSN